MTEVLDPPAAAPANGNGLSRVERPSRPIVADSGEFQNLLDTGKFEHLWRVAQLFASSRMVPESFQDKPADCLIACQMAIRLGVDPFMFMQNTYVYKGKPGMEGKLAIALINSSGLFRGPLRFELAGTGDDFGCVAWAVVKDTGERVEGPRVSIRTAKAEGWYAQNKKWQTIPDLMLQYRAGTWFGRLICPERLMGMQTVEELRDQGAPAEAPVPAVSGVGRLNAALAKKLAPPLDSGQTFDPSTGQVDTETGEVTDQGPGASNTALQATPPDDPGAPAPSDTAPDVTGADAEPPEDVAVTEALAQDVEGYRRVLIDALMVKGESQVSAAKAIDSWIKLNAPKGDGNAIHPDRRRELFDSIGDGRAYVKDGRMLFKAKGV